MLKALHLSGVYVVGLFFQQTPDGGGKFTLLRDGQKGHYVCAQERQKEQRTVDEEIALQVGSLSFR